MKQFILILCLLLTCTAASATHIVGGFITYTKDAGPNPNPRKILYTLTLITDNSSMADDPVVHINMGDGNFVDVPRVSVTLINNYFDREEFKWEYTYGADGTYSASWRGINRNPGILNVAQPSDQLSMLIMTTVNINALRGANSSPQFLAPEQIFASAGQPLNFNLLAFDPDGDSLVYILRDPVTIDATGAIQPLPDYKLPGSAFACQNTTGERNATFKLGRTTGQLTWDAPCRQGEYAFAVAIEQWKGKLKLGEVVYDMMIIVTDNQGKGIVLENTDKLKFTPSGHIEAKVDQPLELKINYSELLQAKAPLPAGFDDPALEEQFASELSQVFNVPVTYTTESTASGTVATFRFTPSRSLIRPNPYFVSFYGSKAVYTSTTSFGIVIRDDQPILKLIAPDIPPLQPGHYFAAAPKQPIKVIVLAEEFPGYVATLTVESTLAAGARLFDIATTDKTEGTVAELIFQPNRSQISSIPQPITFKAVYTPAQGTTGKSIEKELQIQVKVFPQLPRALSRHLAPGKLFIYPNKVLDRFSVEAEEKATLSIYSLQGKLVLEQQLQPGTTDLVRPNTIPGLYFYTITTQNGHKKTGKLILE